MDVFDTRWFRTRRNCSQEKPQEAITMKFENAMNERLVKLDPEHPFMLRPQVCSWYDRSERDSRDGAMLSDRGGSTGLAQRQEQRSEHTDEGTG